MSTRSNKTRARRLGNPAGATRRCPECGRDLALVLNAYWGVRYCRWAAEGKCALTEAQAVENRPRASPGTAP